MGKKATAWLRELGRVAQRYGEDEGAVKRELVERLDTSRFSYVEELEDFHEILCFLRAYPDDRELLASVDKALERFSERPDLQRWREALANSGIDGTPIDFQFYWFTAQWANERWPGALELNWNDFKNTDRIAAFLHVLLPYCEIHTLEDTEGLDTRDLLNLLKGPHESEASFLIQRFDALKMDSFAKEALYEHIDPPLRLSPGPETPNRTRALHRRKQVAFQTSELRRRRPKLPDAIYAEPLAVRAVNRREGAELIRLARECMIVRERDLDVFVHGNPADVRMIDWEDGLQFACIGTLPARRLLLDSVYGFLTLKNAVPMGYVLTSSLFGTSSMAYNVFSTFRGGEAGHVYGRALATARHLFGSDVFFVDPYQLGHENDEGLESGAWWFYYKLGFRPIDSYTKALVRGELKWLRADHRRRSSKSTLNELSAENMYYFAGKPREDMLGRLSLGNVGITISRYLADNYGGDRESGIAECSRTTAKLLSLGSLSKLNLHERQAWDRWSPLVMALGVERWPIADRRALRDVICAKGGQSEMEYVRRFDGHRRLRKAVAKLAR